MEVELCQGLPKALFPHLWHPGMEIQLDSPHIPSWQLPEMVPNPKLKEELNNSSIFWPPCCYFWKLDGKTQWVSVLTLWNAEGGTLGKLSRDCSLWEEF